MLNFRLSIPKKKMCRKKIVYKKSFYDLKCFTQFFNNSIFIIFHSFSSSPDSMNVDRNDKTASGLSTAMYKLIIPLLRCEVVDIRDSVVNALGLINAEALK